MSTAANARDAVSAPSKLAEWIYRELIETYGRVPAPISVRLRRLALKSVRSGILRWGDPVVGMELGGRRVLLHLSHNLPLYKAAHPFYDTSLERLSRFTHRADGWLGVVDVGANVGDTLLQVAGIADARVLCVEADARYLPLLRQNSAGLAGVTCVQAICDEEERTSDTDLVHRSGTSRVTSGGRTNTASTERRHTTLDALMVAQHGMRVNVLKVDTDGYDYRVLRGARRVLERDRPALLIELAPEYLTAAGDDPKTLFPFLAGAGYGEALFYDNIGRPLVRVETASTKALEDLLAYQALGGVAYYDVIAFHASRSAEFDDFLAQERAFFLAHVEPPLKILTPA